MNVSHCHVNKEPLTRNPVNSLRYKKKARKVRKVKFRRVNH